MSSVQYEDEPQIHKLIMYHLFIVDKFHWLLNRTLTGYLTKIQNSKDSSFVLLLFNAILFSYLYFDQVF